MVKRLLYILVVALVLLLYKVLLFAVLLCHAALPLRWGLPAPASGATRTGQRAVVKGISTLPGTPYFLIKIITFYYTLPRLTLCLTRVQAILAL